MEDIKGLKSVLRSLVVSSPTEMTLMNLLRDFRNMMGAPLPITKFGYRDPLQFLKERCGDCFLFQGVGGNPVLVPIVPEQLKHIDSFVQKQKIPSNVKFKGKRRSVAEVKAKPAPDLIAKTFMTSKTPNINLPNVVKEQHMHLTNEENRTRCDTRQRLSPQVDLTNKHEPAPDLTKHIKDNNGHSEHNTTSMEAYKNFLRKRLPIYDSSQDLDNDQSYRDSDSGKCTSESDPHTVSSSSSSKADRLEQLKAEVTQLVLDSPDGVLCTDLMKLYRERYGRELNFSRFGLTSVSALACALPGVRVAGGAADGGALRLHDARAPLGGGALRLHDPRPRVRRLGDPPSSADAAPDADDALPWIDFDPDVFPADCMSFSESIPEADVSSLAAGDMLELMLGEVYSPSHFWFYRLGDQHHIAMENMMDEMTEYYERGSGRARSLAVGAVRVGHYCSSVFERDWHRSLIVQRLDTDTVKVRHVDYGTVDRAAVSALKPLRREWARLPAQAVRARLAGVRPAAAGRRWPHAASAALLRLVRDRRLVGNVLHVDHEENIVELFLIDTSTECDVRIDLELIRGGHADPRGSAVGAGAEGYLFPRFSALESGATPNFADISAYLRDGIALEFVDEYRRHVPSLLEPPRLDTRVPQLAPASPPASDASSGSGRLELEPAAPAEPAVQPPAPAREPDAVAAVAPSARPSRGPALRVAPEPRPPPPPFLPYAPPYPAPVPFLFPPSPHVPPMPMPHMAPMHPMPPYLSCSSMSLHSAYASQPCPPRPPGAFGGAPAVPECRDSPFSPGHRSSPALGVNSPPPPYSGAPRHIKTGQGEVTLSVSECEIFSLLSSVDPNAAHWYMVDAISRAMGSCSTTDARRAPRAAPPSQLNPEACEFRLAGAAGVTPPPGFD